MSSEQPQLGLLLRMRQKAGAKLMRNTLKSVLLGLKAHPKTWGLSKGIERIRNVPYVDGGGNDQQLDIYRPKDAKGPLPVFMYVHGGGFTILSKDTHWMVGPLLAQQGFVVFSINYRLAPEHPFPAAIEDACTAAAWVHDHAAEYGGDPSQMFLGGESAGANLITGISIANCFERPEPWAKAVFERHLQIKATLPAAGILQVTNGGRFKARRPDLSTLVGDRIAGITHGYLGPDPGDTTMADPLVLLESDTEPVRPLPPMMSVVGTKDPILDDSRRLGAALEKRGVDNEISIYPGGLHAFHIVYFTPRSSKCWADQMAFINRYRPSSTTDE